MRRDRVTVLLIMWSGLLSALLAVAINVATGGDLPGPLQRFAWLAWPITGLLAALITVIAVWQQRRTPEPRDETVPAQLPAPRPLLGRAAEIRTIVAAARARTGPVLIAGVPGTGKTALALRAAHDLRARFPDGQLHADLRGSDPFPVRPEMVLVRFLRALGDPDPQGSVDELAARFRTELAGRRVLVFLDDAGTDAQVTPLLPGASGGFALVTSRRQLSAHGGRTIRLGELPAADGRALLAHAAGPERIAADPAGADRIVAACAGLPLAVQLAGARLRARPDWSPGALADRLDDEQRRLGELAQGERAVRGTFRSAYDSLNSAQRLVFRRIGAHPGKVLGLGAATALAGPSLLHQDTSAALERLADAMLVETPAPDRFRLHDLLRLYARELFTAEETAEDRDTCVDRLLAWTTVNVGSANWRADELDNALATVDLAVRTGRHEAAWDLVEAVHRQLTVSGDHVYRLPLWQSALTAASGDNLRQARALRWIAHSYRMDDDLESSRTFSEQGVALAQGDPSEEAHAIRNLGETLRSLGRFDPAREALTRALEGFQALGDAGEEVEVRASLGGLYNDVRRPAEALAVLEPALPLLSPEERPIHAWIHLAFAVSYQLSGREPEATAECELAITIGERLGDAFVLGYCHQERGWQAFAQGDHDRATHHFRQMRTLLEKARSGTGVASADEALGTIAQARGRHREATRHFNEAIAHFERLGDTTRATQARSRRAAP